MDQGYHLYKDYTGNLYPQNRGNHNNVHPNQGIPHHHLHHQHAQQQHHHQQQHQPHVSVHLKHPVPAGTHNHSVISGSISSRSFHQPFTHSLIHSWLLSIRMW